MNAPTLTTPADRVGAHYQACQRALGAIATLQQPTLEAQLQAGLGIACRLLGRPSALVARCSADGPALLATVGADGARAAAAAAAAARWMAPLMARDHPYPAGGGAPAIMLGMRIAGDAAERGVVCFYGAPPPELHASASAIEAGFVELFSHWVGSMLSGHQRQARLRRTAGAFELAREGILITSAQGEILDTNPAFTRITGYSRAEVVGRTPAILQSGRQGPAFYRAMWQTLRADGHWEGEVWNRRKNGELYLETLTISAVHDSAGTVSNYIGFFADVTLQKEHNSRLERLANYDALTGLPNRRLLMDRLRQAMALASRQHSTLAVLYLDLDGFKAVNDRFDHARGDALLTTVARRMTQAVRESDTVARIGGDEFVVVLQNLASIADCIALLERLRSACRHRLQCGQRQAEVSASIGVTFFERGDDDPYQLLQRADRAMYQAKAAGKDRYQFSGDPHR